MKKQFLVEINSRRGESPTTLHGVAYTMRPESTFALVVCLVALSTILALGILICWYF